MTVQSDHSAWGGPADFPPPPGAPLVDLVQVGDLSTDVIPRTWAESILRDLRTENPSVWRRLLGKAASLQP